MEVGPEYDKIKDKNLSRFLNEKKQALSKKDKSSKKNIDEKIAKLIKIINQSNFLFTTSSCSGRILLMKEVGKKQRNAVLQSWHKKISVGKLIEALDRLRENSENKSDEIIYFKVEPFILHITSLSHELATRIVNIARQCGLKKSGFYYGKRQWAIIEIRGNEEISLPLFKDKILVNKDYLNLLVKEANKKLELTWKKEIKFEKEIERFIKKF